MNAINRRTLLRGGLAIAAAAGTGVLTACTGDRRGQRQPADSFVAPDGEEVRTAETRRNPGTIRDVRLTALTGPVDLGGLTTTTWSYDGVLPGRPIRVTAGEVVRATLANQLPTHTTIHWHGLALRNDADGVPDLTQPPIPTSGEHVYQFTAAHPGTYWFHPHAGLQLDRGLYAPLIVEDPREPLAYDDEWIVVLDDWLDGIDGRDPDREFKQLRAGMMGNGHQMGGHQMGGSSSRLLGGDAGDVSYPHFLLNGRLPAAPVAYRGRPGTRLRLRIINAGGDTAFRVALAGHSMQVTHTDGFPVQPVDTDALLVGMGERYDVLVTLADGVFPLVALAEGKNATALGLVRTGSGGTPPASIRPRELNGRLVSYRDLVATEAVRLPDRAPDRTIDLRLTGSMMRYDWGFNDLSFDPGRIEPVRSGERVQINLVNTTEMWHPVHLHGHTFALGETGPRKDTAVVLPRQTLPISFDADNPGLWMVHCHNIYHAEAGMMTLLGYQR
ncbi:multicopper oxidase family protein [Micromonospora sonneratiae]|uniref:Multicopper oxidase family protein n=1 Tax=Micromonospora sonneratiae TaxID=1184706 RepID=A0ABW3YF10_9ACTN